MKPTTLVFIFCGILCHVHLVKADECDKLGTLIYEDLGCKAVTINGEKCPQKFECNLKRSNRTTCLFKAREYGTGESIHEDLTYSSCNIGCFCGEGRITCAVLDCADWLRGRPQSNCYPKHELGKCCSTGQICPPAEGAKTCEVDGQKFQIGQTFYPKNTCLTCVCHEDFNGEFDEKTCVKINCAAQLRNGDDIEANCAPAYFKYEKEVLCCPDDWICPSTSDEIKVINTNINKNSDLQCDYGKKKLKLGEGFERTIEAYGTTRNIQCECAMPPLLICKEK